MVWDFLELARKKNLSVPAIGWMQPPSEKNRSKIKESQTKPSECSKYSKSVSVLILHWTTNFHAFRRFLTGFIDFFPFLSIFTFFVGLRRGGKPGIKGGVPSIFFWELQF